MLEIDLARIIEEARRVGSDNEGHTVAELEEMTNIRAQHIRNVIRQALAEKRCIASRKKVQDISGRWLSVPCYVFKT